METTTYHGFTVVRSAAHARGWKFLTSDGTEVGLVYLKHGGEIEWISVAHDHQRQGIATLMWKFLVEHGQQPRHSSVRTYEGNAWASTIGAEVPLVELI